MLFGGGIVLYLEHGNEGGRGRILKFFSLYEHTWCNFFITRMWFRVSLATILVREVSPTS